MWSINRHILEPLENVHAANNSTEDRVLPVEMMSSLVRDEELARVSVLPLVCHAHYTSAIMRQGSIEFVLKVLAPDARSSPSSAGWITSLNHKIAYISMKRDTLVIPLLCQLDKIPHCFWCILRMKLDVERPKICLNPSVPFGFDPFRLQHVLLITKQSSLATRLWG